MSGRRDEDGIYANGVDIDRLLEQILSDPRLRSSKAFSTTKTYADEPIIRRGSQMDSYLPQKIGQMRELQRTPRGRTWSETRLFYEQARLMEDFEDNCPYHGQFQSYYPTYRTMTDRQLRGYFTWRARVRAGQVEQTATSFAYVYLYELLMGIGVKPGRKAFDAIEAFWKTYRQFDPGMDRYVPEWLVDYVVEHDLPAELAAPYAHLEHDAAIAVLERAEEGALDAAPPKGHRRQPDGLCCHCQPRGRVRAGRLPALKLPPRREPPLQGTARGRRLHAAGGLFSPGAPLPRQPHAGAHGDALWPALCRAPRHVRERRPLRAGLSRGLRLRALSHQALRLQERPMELRLLPRRGRPERQAGPDRARCGPTAAPGPWLRTPAQGPRRGKIPGQDHR